jgi:flagellar hook protein FlgE
MIESIFVAVSGMRGHERALSVISNNVANMNTPGFRGSTVRFADVFHGSAGGSSQNGAGGQRAAGGGVDASRTLLDLRPGEASRTNRDLDVFLEGEGFFVVQDEGGALRYTRAGSFDFNVDGELVVRGTKLKVMARGESGAIAPLTREGFRVSAPRATTLVRLDGILSNRGENGRTIEPLAVFDSRGVKHTLRLEIAIDPAAPAGLSRWEITVFEDEIEIGEGEVEFIGTSPSPGSSPVAITLDLQGVDPVEIDFDFESVMLLPETNAALSLAHQDGYGTGAIASERFDEFGVLKITYTNEQTRDGPSLVLARINDQGGLVERGDSLFEYRGVHPVDFRSAADDLKVRGRLLELSNVDLTQAFSELILMQRGYQASSQVISTANDMLQALLQMRAGQ